MHRLAQEVVIPRLGAICALAPGDFDIVKELFGPCSNYLRAFYSSFRTEDTPDVADACLTRVPGPVRILLGNSGAQSNEHVEVLEWLARYGSDAVQVICPLSYGTNDAYANEVIDAGRKLLGERFRPITKMLPLDEYCRLLDTIDILVFNHRRQQGLFNVYYMISHGKVAYIRHDSTTFPMLKEFGIEVRDTCLIPGLSFSEFAEPYEPEMVERNVAQFNRHLSIDASVSSWRDLLRFFREHK
jgi:hypothetical protein